MKQDLLKDIATGALALWMILSAQILQAEPQHGIAMYGAPALPPDFHALPYVNPDAPKGGSITLANVGTFSSLNPFAAKGEVPWQLRFLTHETLMGRTQDEPFSLYGLLAQSIETPADRSWVEFTLRPEARFSDGSPVTVEDVIWSFETLGTQGHGRYRGFWAQVSDITSPGPGKVRLNFATDNRELALLAGMRPILKKAQWEGKDFAAGALADVPIGSGPYMVDSYEPARFVRLKRNPDYWGADVPFRRGTFNFDEIKIDMYGDGSVQFEGFKAGAVSAMREFNAEIWASNYNFPRVERGDVVKTEIPHKKPSGITGFAINTRKPPFDDWRVREALILAFNYEYISEALTGGAQPRITSYFSNSELAMQPGPAPQAVADLLSPFADALLPGTLEGYALPVADGTVRNRAGFRAAMDLLNQAGWQSDGGVLRNADGEDLSFDILIPQASAQHRAIADLYIQGLERLGITARTELVDPAQFTARTAAFDFDLAYYRRAVSLSPGNEQRFYWGSAAADQEGSRNLPGIQSPAIDAMIDVMLTTQDPEMFKTAVRALDRLLISGRYVIPFWQYAVGRIAHVAEMKHPETWPLYGDGPEYMPQAWWWESK